MNHLALALVLSAAATLAACGKPESTPAAPAAAPATTSAPAAAPAAAPAPTATAGNAELGKSVYSKTCALCHAANVAGAPKPGDKADWGPRIAQGNDTLYKHAIEGYTGSKGQMPAKGGNSGLSDDEVKAGVDYMVSQSR
ncbi:c-type cytochrome [Ramlibacter sp.]|uniref:c-type cytochrome n=1 Tax=Ramlibacter sp. TaxID=1917967 RepID=UPI002FC78360